MDNKIPELAAYLQNAKGLQEGHHELAYQWAVRLREGGSLTDEERESQKEYYCSPEIDSVEQQLSDSDEESTEAMREQKRQAQMREADEELHSSLDPASELLFINKQSVLMNREPVERGFVWRTWCARLESAAAVATGSDESQLMIARSGHSFYRVLAQSHALSSTLISALQWFPNSSAAEAELVPLRKFLQFMLPVINTDLLILILRLGSASCTTEDRSLAVDVITVAQAEPVEQEITAETAISRLFGIKAAGSVPQKRSATLERLPALVMRLHSERTAAKGRTRGSGIMTRAPDGTLTRMGSILDTHQSTLKATGAAAAAAAAAAATAAVVAADKSPAERASSSEKLEPSLQVMVASNRRAVLLACVSSLTCFSLAGAKPSSSRAVRKLASGVLGELQQRVQSYFWEALKLEQWFVDNMRTLEETTGSSSSRWSDFLSIQEEVNAFLVELEEMVLLCCKLLELAARVLQEGTARTTTTTNDDHTTLTTNHTVTSFMFRTPTRPYPRAHYAR